MGYRRLLSSIAILGLLGGVAACGSADEPSASASDKASGVTVSITGDQVTLKRASSSESGKAGIAAQVSCTDDYAKLVKATEQPAPNQPWYAATLITWPDKAKATTATLSHALTGSPDLCLAESSDSSTQVVVYFGSKVKAAIEKQQTDTAREQQAAQASDAIKSAAQLAVSTVASGKFSEASALVEAMTAQGLYVKTATSNAEVVETGTIYLVSAGATSKRIVLAIKGADGKVTTATQKTTGEPKLATSK
jgi:hypothetical protein